jgi:dihydrofolate synthase/folylpolyglutamate synthase
MVTAAYTESPVALAGAHQRRNASLAIAALRRGGITAGRPAIVRGLANVRWPARFQSWDARIIIDGAHNPAGASVLAETWREQFGDDRAAIVLSVLADKDLAGIWRALAPIAQRVILPPARTERAAPPMEVARTLVAITPSLEYSVVSSLTEALSSARATSARILVTGSLHFAGEALATLEERPAAFEECAQ